MDKVSNFKNRLLQSISESGLSQIEIAEKAGISKSLLNKYIKGVSEAGNHKLLLLSNALNLNPLWLMGYDVQKYKMPESQNEDDVRSPLIQQILNVCNDSSEDELKMILRVIKSMVNKQ